MDRGTKLMMALSSSRGALGVTGKLLSLPSQLVMAVSLQHDRASPVQLNVGLLLYFAEMH